MQDDGDGKGDSPDYEVLRLPTSHMEMVRRTLDWLDDDLATLVIFSALSLDSSRIAKTMSLMCAVYQVRLDEELKKEDALVLTPADKKKVEDTHKIFYRTYSDPNGVAN